MEYKFNAEKEMDDYIKAGLAKYDTKAGVELFRSNNRLGERVGFEVLENGERVGAIMGKIDVFDYLHVTLLYVEEEHRGKDVGTKLVTMMEEWAINQKLNAVTLNTFSFQAKGFYLRLGYQIYGEFIDKKTGVSRYMLRKEL